MSTKPKDVKKKLDELYWKTDEVRKDLISLHNLLQGSGYFDERPQANVYQHNVPPPVVPQPVAPPPPQPEVQRQVPPPPVVPPPVQQPQYQPQYQPPQTKYVPPPPPQPKKPGFFERNPDLEKFIGERLVTFIGIIVLVTGIAFFVKYAIDKNWINETGRTAIGILSGGVLLGVAHRLRKSFTAFSSVLVGGGISVLYFTISYAFQVYQLFPQAVAFGLLVVITAFTVMLAVAYDRKELAILALLGGFSSPIMVSTGQGNLPVLCTYMLILDIGMLVLAYYKKWNVVNIISYVLTLLLFAGAVTREVSDNVSPRYMLCLVYATLFYLTFFIMNVINNVRLRQKFTAFEVIMLLSNSFLYYACGYFILQQTGLQQYHGLFTLLVAVFNFGFAFALFRRQEVDRTLVYFLIGLVITFVSLAGPVQLEGNHITLFWAAEGALLLWLWQRSGVKLIRYASVIISAVMLLSLLYNWMNVYLLEEEFTAVAPLSVLLNKGFITGIFVVLSLAVTSFLLSKEKSETVVPGWAVDGYRAYINVMAAVFLFLSGFLELWYQLGARHTGSPAMVIYMATYTGLFTIAAWYAARGLKFDYFITPVTLIGVLLVVVYAMVPHYFTVQQRDHYLINGLTGDRAFLFHYMYTAVIVALLVLIYRHVAQAKTDMQLRNVYLWIMCFTLVFIVSSELDHFVVLNGFDAGVPVSWSEGMARIDHLTAQSHKIGFPIAWGICSFVMIVIGMKKQIRQLRIIALTLFFATVVKLILLGVYGESQTGKIVAFILSGVILLTVSFMYQKLKKIILEEDQPSAKNENHETLS